MKIILITPPLTQINTPYPATLYLKSFLNSQNIPSDQYDLGLEFILKLFSKRGLSLIHEQALKFKNSDNPSIHFFLEAYDQYQRAIEPVVFFLQGQDSSLAIRIAQRNLVPEGPRFAPLYDHPEVLELFGSMGTHDKAKHIASLFMDDIADVIRLCVDSKFEFSKYGEQLASAQNSMDSLYDQLQNQSGLLENLIIECLDEILEKSNLNFSKNKEQALLGFTVPFPGNLYATLVACKYLKSKYPQIKTVMGGGYVNTELRELNDPRFFEFIDFLIFDDGEKPILNLIEYLKQTKPESSLVRTKYLKNGVVLNSDFKEKDISFSQLKAPDYTGISLNRYLSLLEMLNPMHRMWSDYKWNKLILAHGCYWKKCTFCDVNLDYIGRFEPHKVDSLFDQMVQISKQTGSTGFHFVDEAAPPAILKNLSKKIIEENSVFSWWGNIRFDSQFTPEVTQLMADAGCIAVTGGLEVASPRLLKLINKGVTLEQVAQVTKAFKNSGIYVHAYLMYGFPTQTEQETIDSLEIVRQLFLNECLDSAFWHRFVATIHSPIAKDPKAFNIQIQIPEVKENFFAVNEVPFFDPTNTNHDALGEGLKKALYNYMHGIGLEEDVRNWFEFDVPKAQVSKNKIFNILKN